LPGGNEGFVYLGRGGGGPGDGKKNREPQKGKTLMGERIGFSGRGGPPPGVFRTLIFEGFPFSQGFARGGMYQVNEKFSPPPKNNIGWGWGKYPSKEKKGWLDKKKKLYYPPTGGTGGGCQKPNTGLGPNPRNKAAGGPGFLFF